MKVADLTVEELRTLIKEAVQEELREILDDPDKELQFRPEFEARLRNSLASTERITFDEVKNRLNLQ